MEKNYEKVRRALENKTLAYLFQILGEIEENETAHFSVFDPSTGQNAIRFSLCREKNKALAQFAGKNGKKFYLHFSDKNTPNANQEKNYWPSQFYAVTYYISVEEFLPEIKQKLLKMVKESFPGYTIYENLPESLKKVQANNLHFFGES